MGQRRLFVGLAPDERTAEDLHAAARASLGERGWRFYPARDIHLTLCFLGAVEEASVGALERSLHGRLRGFPAPRLSITGLGAFPGWDRPRVVWAGVRGAIAGGGEIAEGEKAGELELPALPDEIDKADDANEADAIERLNALARTTVEACLAVGLHCDRKPRFTPHITLARPTAEWRRTMPDARPFERAWIWRPDRVLLFESLTGGPEHHPRRIVAHLASS